jgi:nucleoside-diphosphate-sugar epimerase
MIFTSTIKVHGEESDAPFTELSPIAPQDRYAESKARAEERLRRIAGMQLTVLRPPLMYGPHVKANFLALMKAVAHGMPLPFAGVTNRRSILYVGNFADGVIQCLAHASALDIRARLFHFPAALLGALPGLRALARSLEVDDAAIRQRLQWQPPYSDAAGLEATADWFRRR